MTARSTLLTALFYNRRRPEKNQSFTVPFNLNHLRFQPA
jgi:hypothetical protein